MTAGPPETAIWALFANRPGDNAQIETLAAATGLAWTPKRLRFVKIAEALPNVRRGGSLFSLTAETRAALRDAPPAVVIAAGKRSAPAALWVRRASRGRTRLVHIGRTWAPLGWFDLVITTPQYLVPARPNVVENAFPLTAPVGEAVLRPDLAALPRPRIAVVVGGSASPFLLDPDAAFRLARHALAAARAAGGSLMVATSPRTAPRAVAALRDALGDSDVAMRLSVFGESRNDYRAFLAAADRLIVTEDSVSMATEAALTGKPVELFALPRRFDPELAAIRALERAAARTKATRALRRRLAEMGATAANRDVGRFARMLAEEGFLAGGPGAATRAAAELGSAAARVRALAAAAGA